MPTSQCVGAIGAPPPVPPEALQRSRILARVGLSPALADVVAELAYGGPRRDHGLLLVDLTACRTASAGAARL